MVSESFRTGNGGSFRAGALRAPTVTGVTTKSYAPDLTDTALRDEIELIADLVVAAAGCSGRMSESQIDEALGLCPSRSHTA